MWIGDVDVPNGLVAAHRAGRLVLFVGAGTSIDPPSRLPTFVQLAEGIALGSGHSPDAYDRERPDQLLGKLDLDGAIGTVDVHRRVADRIGNTTSQPNELHRAIAALAGASPQQRVVTTNYDLHLSAHLDAKELMAPALPMGDDFEGLVYLHGSLAQDPRFLVVTDRDFGRAYLTDAWAARFLERMFREFVVLFIGYSHDDVVMSYLARGLPRGTERYVFTHEAAHEKWRHLGIRPVEYSLVVGDSHESVRLCIDRWAQLMAWGLLDHERRVRDLVATPPSLVPEEMSYLEDVVGDPTRVRFFTDSAGIAWLSWASERPEFQELFDPRAAVGESGVALAHWFAAVFVAEPDHCDAALRIVQSNGGRLNDSLWFAIAQRIHAIGGPRPEHLSVWLMLLVEAAPDTSHDLLDYALDACQWPVDREVALQLLDHLATPHLGFDRFRGSQRVTVSMRGSDHWLQSAWEKFFKPNIDEVAPDVIAIADHHLRTAYRVLGAASESSAGVDGLSYRRSAIEHHGQDSLRDGIHGLIDVARDALVALIRVDSELGPAYLHSWARSDLLLLRRLALHAWAERQDVAADEKILWLLATGWLYDWQVQHEVFALVAKSLAESSDEVAQRLLDAVLAGPEEATEDSDHTTYNLLVWLAQSAPDFSPVTAALASMQEAHPEFAPRDHPDFTSWLEVGAVGPQPPMEPGELHDAIVGGAATALEALLQFRGNSSPWGGTTWHDTLGLVRATVTEWPEDGHALAAAVEGEADGADVVVALIDGWGRAALDESQYAAVVDAVMELLDGPGVVDAAARFLLDQAKVDGEREWASHSQRARSLAVALWRSGTASGEPEPHLMNDDWLGSAINSWAGRVAEFWAHSISSEWSADPDGWDGFAPGVGTALEDMVDGDGLAHALAQVVLASQLHFFFGADTAWTCDRVLPLLDWQRSPDTAPRCWDGYLKWGRDSDRLLEAGMLAQYLGAVPHVPSMNDELQRSFCEHLANVAVQSEVDPWSWLSDFTSQADAAIRIRWMQAVGWQLDHLGSEVAEAAWHGWMKQYWEGRLASIPVVLAGDEASAIAEWAPFLSESFGEAVDLSVSVPARVLEHTSLLHELPRSNLVHQNPHDVSRFVAHLLSGTHQPFYECHPLAELVPLLRASVGLDGVKDIVEEALGLGCIGASDW